VGELMMIKPPKPNKSKSLAAPEIFLATEHAA
jgi:hypothetical protein